MLFMLVIDGRLGPPLRDIMIRADCGIETTKLLFPGPVD